MKLKKILVAIAALAMSASAFSNIVLAADYGSPEVTMDIQYPVEDPYDEISDDLLVVNVNYDGIENLARNSKALKSVTIELDYDTDALEYYLADDGDIGAGTPGTSVPAWAAAWALNNKTPYAGSALICSMYFKIKDGVDFDKQKVDFSFKTANISIQSKTDGDTKLEPGNGLTAVAGSYGTEAPVEEDKFEAKVNGDEITFENADLSTDNKEIAGKAIKIFGKTFTVNAKSKFVISAQGTTKTFGKTAAEYLGLEGDGEATGNVTVGIIYDKEQYKASDFSIATE